MKEIKISFKISFKTTKKKNGGSLFIQNLQHDEYKYLGWMDVVTGGWKQPFSLFFLLSFILLLVTFFFFCYYLCQVNDFIDWLIYLFWRSFIEYTKEIDVWILYRFQCQINIILENRTRQADHILVFFIGLLLILLMFYSFYYHWDATVIPSERL